MNIINDQKIIQEIMQKHQVEKYFDTPDLLFKIYEFDNGEQITGPDKRLDKILFLFDGIVRVRGIDEDGRNLPITSIYGWTILGDVEFCQEIEVPYYAESKGKTRFLGIDLNVYREEIEQDAKFLKHALESVAKKFLFYMVLDSKTLTVEERTACYLRNICINGELKNIEDAILRLHCSRRQMQRVLEKFCRQGSLIKVGKGHYKIRNDNL